MATLIQESEIQHDSVVINDIGPQPANTRTDSTLDLKTASHDATDTKSKTHTSQLNLNDKLFGPLEIGQISVTRVALDALGARINGQPLNGDNTFFRVPKRSFVNSLQFSLTDIETHMKSANGRDAYLLPNLLFDIASRRPLTAPRMIRENPETTVDPGNLRSKLEKLLNAAHKLDLRHASLPKNTPVWVSKTKSYSALGASVGIQGFGIFMGIRGVYEAIKVENTNEVVINATGILTEVSSIAVDLAITHEATRMITAGQQAYKDFARTRFAVRLSRSGGLIGGALTLPFDLYTAVRSFTAAENTTGKEAMDQYVSAALSITSAAMTVILGAAAMAGFSFAGPVGLLAGVMLAIGSQVYGAVRAVDDIDDYIELSINERWQTGFLAFFLQGPPSDVQNRFLIAKAKIDHAKQLKESARALLEGPLKETTEAVVNGSFDVELVTESVRKQNWWTKKWDWDSVSTPKIKDGDDAIDAREGVTDKTPGAETGTGGENKGVLWFMGGGDDAIQGVEKKPNAFYFETGKKQLTGGDKDDHFVFQGAEVARPEDELADRWTLRGGAGNDSLILGKLAQKYAYPKKPLAGYNIDLAAGTIHTVTLDPLTGKELKRSAHSTVESIENVETIADTSTTVIGTDGRNVIKARGTDIIRAGAGNDQIHLLQAGASVWGGPGQDEYFIDNVSGTVSLFEDGVEDSVIVLNFRMELIDHFLVMKDGSLTVVLNSDLHGKTRLVIADVYEQKDGKLKIKNNKITFVTNDRFYLAPDFLESIDSGGHVTLDAIILKRGFPINPIILYSETCDTNHENYVSYYLPRNDKNITFRAIKRTRECIKIHLDYASNELTKVEVAYGAAQDDGYWWGSTDLIYHFGEKSLKLVSFSKENPGLPKRTKEMGKFLEYLQYTPEQRYVFVFNDGNQISAKITKIEQPTETDYPATGFIRWKSLLPMPLNFRWSGSKFELPENDAYALSPRGACINFSAAPGQNAMECLEGAGGTYILHLVAEQNIKIGTPGGLASASVRLPHSSTWELDATKLGNVEIRLENNKLYIGTCTIHLPEYGSEDIIDTVHVIDEKGIIRTVDLSFDLITITGVDAQYFIEPPDFPVVLSGSYSPVAELELPVRNATLYHYPTFELSYSFPKRRWITTPYMTNIINSSHLKVHGRCNHQLPKPQLTSFQQSIVALDEVPVS
ncbi:calcium-binding protein [Pseudomonas sp. NPDC087598]|uniref:calcium-binding protein n=1 Tax=Pseudomonas sp. NPDC087598 TaxID=3364440 RepID=UPI003822D284